METFTSSNFNAIDPGRKRLCIGKTDLYFSPDFEQPAARNAREEVAKALCRACPIVGACLDTAIANDEVNGVWGGESFERGRRETRQMRRKRIQTIRDQHFGDQVS